MYLMLFSHMDFKYIDAHTHFFPKKLFKAIWKFFEMKDHKGNVRGWPIEYKLEIEGLVDFLKNKNVEAYTTYKKKKKKGIAKIINEWTIEFAKDHPNAIPFGCVWPEDKDKKKYVESLFADHNFQGIKIQPLVQNFYPYDPRMDEVYELILDYDKWLTIHAGTAPYRNKYVGYKSFKKFIKKYPTMNIIVAHMGAFEYQEFIGLLDKYDNLYLDSAMVFIPNNIFPERKIKRPAPEILLSYQDRILFGSDFPNIPYEYERSSLGFLEMDLPRNFYEDIFYNNAQRLFDL